MNSTRRHDIDALRVIAFGLLILYHVGMFYVADWGWHIKSAYLAEWLQHPMLLLNRWRMSLLFLVSGLAVNFLLKHASPGEFAGSRIKRLLLPLAFGMAVVVPPQAYLQAVSNGAFAGNYLEFLAAYFTFQPWPDGAFDGSHVGITWNHLWYLPYLLVYSLVLATALPLLHSGAGRWLADRFRSLRGVWLVLLPSLPLTLAAWFMDYPSTHDLVTDWENHARYFTVFLFGYWLGTDKAMWEALRRMRWALLIAGVASFAAHRLLIETLTGAAPAWHLAAYDFFKCLNVWTWLCLVLAWGHHLLNQPFRWLPYATEAVYPWYILHQTLTVIAGFWLAKWQLGPVVEPLLVIAVTVGGCLLLHEFVVRRMNWLRPLFGLKGSRVMRSAGGAPAGIPPRPSL